MRWKTKIDFIGRMKLEWLITWDYFSNNFGMTNPEPNQLDSPQNVNFKNQLKLKHGVIAVVADS